jgi:hypothetical protein
VTDSHWQNNCLIRSLYCDNLNPYPHTSARAETREAEQARCTHAGQTAREREGLRTQPKALGLALTSRALVEPDVGWLGLKAGRVLLGNQ